MFVQFLQESDAALGPANKLSSTQEEDYFVDNTLIIKHLAAALQNEILYTKRGPVRQHFVPLSKETWDREQRYNLYKILIEAFGEQGGPSSRLNVERTEINKQLSKIKDPGKRMERKTSFEEHIRRVRLCSFLAIEELMKLGNLFPKDHSLERSIPDIIYMVSVAMPELSLTLFQLGTTRA